ncbi:MAG TPA: hypothetical protein VNZ27_03310 [Rhodanobacter sp.]|jgi:YD repeat-containing protein|nr:hypothetical protein [Rhodanobacter sp.]
MRVWQGICLSAVLLFSFGALSHAQSVTPEDEYKKLIKVDRDIQPLGAHPFGENISLYDGTLSFEQADVSVPGNGPTLQLSRSLGTANVGVYVDPQRPFGDWDLEIPRIETEVGAPTLTVTGALWRTANSATARCTYFNAPPVYGPTQPGADPWTPDQWWHGYHLMLPGQGSQELLARSTANSLSPTISGMSFPIVTKQNWMIACGVTASDGGEGFLAIAPDGTRYTFAHLVYRPMESITSSLGTAPMAARAGGSVSPRLVSMNLLLRRDALMYVTQIQDRFGNTLTYTYDPTSGYLTDITASDGRHLTLTYVSGTPQIHSVTVLSTDVSARTWTYSYSGGTNGVPIGLTSVQLPDGSAWSYNLGALELEQDPTSTYGDCSTNMLATVDATPVTGTITHPSGLTGTFTLQAMMHGRSYVPKQCYGPTGMSTQPYSHFPEYYSQFSLTSESLAGAGLPTPTQTWTYNYSTPNQSWTSDACASNNSCPSAVYTDVVDPEGHDVRSTFSNRFDASEGQVLRTDFYAAGNTGAILRSETNSYANPTGGPWPVAYGNGLQGRVNRAQSEALSPLSQRAITQDGDTYTWLAEGFNAYAQVIQTKRSNSIAGQSAIEEATTYLNDPALWVLGLTQQVTNLTTGEVESLNTYNTSNDTLLSRARFGQPLMSYTFNSAGQLASFTDGNSHTTSLSNYKRGIPQTIGYPDSTSETLVIDDFGQISAITDQAAHTTSYFYDGGGRVNEIDYPANDEQPWLKTLITTAPVPGDERGLVGPHWKRTTTTGNAVGVTYFDAMLRPVLSDSDIGASVQASTLATYDSKGQKTFSAYPSTSALTFTQTPTASGIQGGITTYDALGRATQVQQNSELGTLTSSTAYLSGAQQQVTDPKGNVTTTSYQVFDSPSYNAPILVQAPAGITQAIARDLYGNPLSITQSGLYGTESDSVTKTLTYDAYHRLCRTTEPESGSEVMGYDGANNLAWSVSGATLGNDGSCHPELAQSTSVITRTYDAMNRVWTIQAPTGTQSTQYHYTPLGQPDSIVSGISTWTGAYNFRGMLTGESLQLQVAGLNAWGIGYAHDVYGSLSLVHYPDGENVSYAPDALGRPTQAGSDATGISYFPNGQVAQFAYANGTSYVAAQNTRQMLSNFSYGAGSTVQLSEDLSYDANGNITAVADLTGGPRTKSFGYDALNRLSSANAANLWGAQAYTYDALNNLRTLQTGSQTSTYNYDPTNKLASISNGGTTLTSYLYDNRGNVTGKNATTLVFDQKNQLTQIPGSDTYAYDAAGRRVSKTAGGVTTYYFYSQAGQLMYQWAPGSALSTSFVYLGSKLVGDNESVVLGAPATIGFDPTPSNGSYTVSWGAVLGATSYVLQESANGGGWTTVYSGSATSSALSGRAGGSYVYQVEGCIGTTCGVWTSSATLGVTPTLPTVTVPSGTINGTYTVSWTAPATASAYMVQERLNGGAWTTIAASTAANAISRPGTTSGSYTYQVAAYNNYGTRGWAGSNAVTVDTTYGVLPTAPAGLTVPASSNTGGATLSWSASNLTTRYVVEQSSNGGTSWTGIYNSSGTSTAVSGLADGSYVFHVQACNTYGCSAWVAGSATLVVTHPPTTAPTISTPANSTNGSYTVSWSGVAGPVSYTLQEQINGGGWTTVQTNGMTSWSTSGRGNGTYGYHAQACNVGGCGPWSAVASTTVLLVPPVPSSISVPATSNGPIAISWAASATATIYGLDQSVNGGAWAQVYANSATSTTVTAGSSGSYSFRAYACNASGCNGYATSGAVAVTIPPASAPSLSVPASSTNGSYTVSWGAVSAATSYTLQEQVNGGGWTTVQANGSTSWGTSGKGNGTYGYHVQACNAGGCGPWSGVGTITVALIPAAPAVPYIGVSGPYYKPVVLVSWAAVPNATSYQLEQTDPVNGVNIVYIGSSTSLSQLILVNGTVQFRVMACSSAGCSAFSGYRSVTLHSGT